MPGRAMGANHLSRSKHSLAWNSTHSVQECLCGCVSPGTMASVPHARTHLLYADTRCRELSGWNGKVPPCVWGNFTRGKRGNCDPRGDRSHFRGQTGEQIEGEEEWELTVGFLGVNLRWPCCVYPGCSVAPPSLPTMPDLLRLDLLTVSQVRTFVDRENIS